MPTGPDVRAPLLFIQGAGEGTHADWDAALVASLRAALGADVEIRYPPMPNEGEPDYGAWSAAILDEIARLDDDAIVVGHSLGGTILVHALAERPTATRLRAIILVAAPYVGEGGWPAGEWTPQTALGERLPSGAAVLFFHGTADDTVPPTHATLYAKAIPQAHLTILPGRDHQLNGDMREVAAVIVALHGDGTPALPCA